MEGIIGACVGLCCQSLMECCRPGLSGPSRPVSKPAADSRAKRKDVPTGVKDVLRDAGLPIPKIFSKSREEQDAIPLVQIMG